MSLYIVVSYPFRNQGFYLRCVSDLCSQQTFLSASFFSSFLRDWDEQRVTTHRHHFLRVCAIFDHYGYQVPSMDDWEDLTWYSIPLTLSHVETLLQPQGSSTRGPIQSNSTAGTSHHSTGAAGPVTLPPSVAGAMTVALYGEVLWPSPPHGHGKSIRLCL